MDLSQWFWLFLMLSAIQPVLQKRMLEAARTRLIARIERKRNSRVILLVHRQETMSFLGFPLMRYIDVQDAEEVIRAIRLTDPEVPIDLVLHTPGGLVLAALQIARAICRHPGPVTAFVPHYAMSGGTLIALAADRIVMSEHAVLGPVDPQLGRVAAASVLDAVSRKPPEKLEDETLFLADQARKAVAQVTEAVVELLGDRHPPERARAIAKTLATGRWTHDYPITPRQAADLGLPVETDFPEDFLQLMRLFPQPVRQAPGVEYLPERRTGGNGAAG